MPLRLPKKYAGKVDENKWEKNFDIDNIKSYTMYLVIAFVV